MQSLMPSKISAYVSGPLTNSIDWPSLKVFYQQIADLCAELGLEPFVPQPYELNLHKSPRKLYEFDMKQVSRAGILLAYVGSLSHGVGAEIERAVHSGTDVILLYEQNVKVSPLIKGCPAVIDEVIFSDFDDALAKLRPVLEQWLSRR